MTPTTATKAPSKLLITDPAALKPDTDWRETAWAWTSEEELANHHSVTRLCSAALLPFHHSQPDWQGFVRALQWQFDAAQRYGIELVPVLNADTGYIFDLSRELYSEVLRRFRQAFPGAKFIAGITLKGELPAGSVLPRDVAKGYLPLMDIVQQHENCEVMVMTSQALAGLQPEAQRDAYFAMAEHLKHPGIVHALEPAFVPWARPFGPWLLWQLASHPKFVAGKISTLDQPHFLYWAAMVRALKLDFQPHSGDDFGLATAIKLGLPLLVGAASSAAPLICAAKDMWLVDSVASKKHKTGTGSFDTRVYKLLEALQSFEDQVFRPDAQFRVSAYKHSTAHLLHHLGLIASPEAHPACRDLRGSDESQRMEEALRRVRRIAEVLEIEGF